MSQEMQRNSSKVLAVRALEAARFYVPVVLLYSSTRDAVDGAWALLATAAFWAYTSTRVVWVFGGWWTTRFTVDDNGIELHTGLLMRERIAVAWGDMVSVNVSRSLLHRRLGCALVRVETGSRGRGLTLEAVLPGVVDGIEELYRLRGAHDRRHGITPGDGDAEVVLAGPSAGVRPMETQAAAATSPGSPQDELVYAMRPLDYLLLSVTYGQFALFLPAVLGGYSEASKRTGLPTAELLQVFQRQPHWWAVALVVLAAVVGALGYGCGVAWLRYRSFTVRRYVGGLVITRGLVSHESRQVLESQVAGLRLEQNPLMRVLGYAKMGVVSREPGRKVGSNVLFPVVKLPLLAQSVEEFFPDYSGMLRLRRAPRRVFDFLVPAVVVGLVLVAWAAVRAVRAEVAAPVVSVVALVLLIVANRAWTAAELDIDARSIRFRRGFLWVKLYEFPIASVHLVLQSQGPVGRSTGVCNLSLFLHDGRRVRLRLFACPGDLPSRISRAIVLDRARDRQTPAAVPEAV